MSSMNAIASNYKNICDQIKRHYAEIMDLKRRKAEIEVELTQILERIDGPGIVVDGAEIFIEKKQRRQRVGKKRKNDEIIQILQAHNVQQPEEILKQITDLGEVEEKSVVKLKNRVVR